MGGGIKLAHLTEKEKASRYDALQTTFKYAIERYQDRQSEAEGHYNGPDPISAYNKGLADAYGFIIKDLEMWR